jgi:hypothetical protein
LKEIIQQYLNDNYKLEKEIFELKRIYFYSIAVSTKMNLSSAGIHCNLDVGSLFEKALESAIQTPQWPQWIHQQMSNK